MNVCAKARFSYTQTQNEPDGGTVRFVTAGPLPLQLRCVGVYTILCLPH